MLSSKIYVEDNITYIIPSLDGEYITEYDLVSEKEKLEIYESIHNKVTIAIYKKIFS